MLQLARQGRSALRTGFICTSCRALLASGATRPPGAVTRLCAARHYSSTEQQQPQQCTEKTAQQTEKKSDKKPDRKPDKKPDKKSDKKSEDKPAKKVEKSKSSPQGGRKQRGRSASGTSSSPSSASRLQLWRETLKVLKDIKTDQGSSSLETKHAAAAAAATTGQPPAPPAATDPGQDTQPGKTEKPPREAKLLEGALTVLKKVLRQELKDAPPIAQKPAEPAPSKKRPATALKEETSSQAERPKTKTLAEALSFIRPTADNKPPPEKPAVKATKTKSGSSTPAPSKLLAGLAPVPGVKGHREIIVKRVDASQLELTPVVKPQPPVPSLAYDLDRVLFNPGVYHIQDPRSRVFNFDPYLERIMPIKEFDFNAIKQYVTSSKDNTLIQTAAEHNKKYTGSTSSMTSTLAHFHFLLSAWRPINPAMMSRGFEVDSHRFTRIMRSPAATFLHWKDGTYAIDADKEFDTANVLSMLGKSMEKFLTLPKEEFEKYRKRNSDQLTDEERNGPESYHYTTLGDFMMRSQLDAYDPRLPGTGMFDLKTRAVISIRMDAKDFHKGLGYEIRNRFGLWESFEREYYDMIRSAFLKYSLQVRMGRMDGIFVAFHNTERIFGFQYIPLPEMDLALHGQTNVTLGDREFKLSVHLLNKVLNKVTKKYPGRSLRLHFETRGDSTPFMYVFAKPVTPEEVEAIQGAATAKIDEFERQMMGLISEEEQRALEDEDAGDEAVDDADELDIEDFEGEEVTSSAAWEDVMLKVEHELEDEEHGVTFIREAVEDALQESGLLRTMAPDETQRYVDAFLEALTNTTGSRAASEDQASSDKAESQVAGRGEAESQVESTDGGALDTDATTTSVPTATDSQVEESTEKLEDDNASPGAPTLKDLIVKLATQIRAIPSERRTLFDEEGEEEVIDEDAPAYAPRLRKIERILSELTEQPQEDVEKAEEKEEEEEKGVGSGIIETGSVSSEEEPTDASTTPSPEEEDPTIAAAYAEESDTGGELYGLILTVRNKVDGEYVARPEKLRPAQRWTVEYAMEEVKPERAQNLYKMVLKRRKKLLYDDTAEDAAAAAEGGERDRWFYMFRGRLERYSDRGRQFRHRENRRQRQSPVHVYGCDKPFTYESVFEGGGAAASEDGTGTGTGTAPYEEWPGEPAKKSNNGSKAAKKKKE
ncbi:mitochondrial protein Pet127-domain-containing protein [Chaetomidium leptoderma]|uniref:Mitochondrial protein Pet127-domain-containing protein n=1 Tax=Chaetomidium leptoderma TaxID=669021 RepID=A0AAN6ZZW3_9PEZI|nr:mitochondrial protein Pet127-domain-containing protein [Chaetomidium leptoderma]